MRFSGITKLDDFLLGQITMVNFAAQLTYFVAVELQKNLSTAQLLTNEIPGNMGSFLTDPDTD